MEFKYYLRLWKTYLKLNVENWMEYRLDFFVGIIAMFLSNFTSVVFFWVIFENIVQVNGWTFWQMIFLVGLSALAVGIWHAFLVGTAPWRLERHIRSGSFDRLLIQPVNPFVCLLISNIDDDGFGDLIAGILLVYLGAINSGISLSLSNILLLGIFIAGAVLIFYSVTILISSLSFWITRSGALAEIIWSLMRFTDLPLEIYNPIISFILTFIIPIAFINYYPAEFFLGKGIYTYFAYLTPLIGIIFFFISYKFWKVGLKNYTSTGS